MKKKNHGTALLHVDGAYIEFQKAVIGALPRAIDPGIVAGWLNNLEGLKKVLRETLLPPVPLVQDFLRETEELSIQIPALKRPTLKQLQEKWSWIKSIERDNSTEEPVTLNLATVLRVDEKNLINNNNKEYERRLSPNISRLLGCQHFEWLVSHQDEYPVFMNLLGKIYIDFIDFPGLVALGKDGFRGVPYSNQNGERWGASWRWLSGNFHQNGRVAVSSK